MEAGSTIAPKDLVEAGETALRVAREAAEIVKRVYATPFDVGYKTANDPVTLADREANALVCDRLSSAFPGVPIVAEESDPATYNGFAGAERAFFVDPLDGTREFVDRNGEFAVMVGLAVRGRAMVGAVVAPAWGRSFLGIVGVGAWELTAGGARQAIQVSSRESLGGASVVVSRSRRPSGIVALLEAAGAGSAVVHGSSGLKAALVASGVHDIYVHPGPAGLRWDACASEALVLAAGGAMTDVAGAAIDYATRDLTNRGGLLASNGLLHRAIVDVLGGQTGRGRGFRRRGDADHH